MKPVKAVEITDHAVMVAQHELRQMVRILRGIVELDPDALVVVLDERAHDGALLVCAARATLEIDEQVPHVSAHKVLVD